MERKVFSLLLAFFLFLPIAHAQTANVSIVTVTNGENTTSFAPFDGAFALGIAVADLGGDGTPEILVGAGAHEKPLVKVFREDGSEVGEFLAYNENYTGGVTVAACDVDGNGSTDIVTGTSLGGGPHVRVFTNMGEPMFSFFAYSESFRGGVNVACGDVDGDGINEIVTGAGLTGGAHVKVWNGNGTLMSEWFLDDATKPVGANVNVVGNALETTPYGIADSLSSDDGLVTAASTSVTKKNAGRAVTMTLLPILANDVSPQYIRVDLSEQRLTAYAYGIPVNSFLVSTGVRSHPTPLGKTPITDKLLWHDYSWYYGQNNPANYSLPNVKYNLRFRTHLYIHYAYWHHNFGHVMSHGCVNTGYNDAQWIYDWANVGTNVEIAE